MGSAEETAINVLINTIFEHVEGHWCLLENLSHFVTVEKSASWTSGVNSNSGFSFGLLPFSCVYCV